MSGSREPLTITPIDPATGEPAAGTPFKAMINPANYSRSAAIKYTGDGTKLRTVNRETLKLAELVLDGTGVIETQDGRTVDQQLKELRELLLINDKPGVVLRPVVRVSWSSLAFTGRLETMKVNYTLFKPDGTPLRARVELGFKAWDKDDELVQARDAADAALTTQKKRQTAASRLDKLCFDVYRDPSKNQLVARQNGLTSFRNVPAGTELELQGQGD